MTLFICVSQVTTLCFPLLGWVGSQVTSSSFAWPTQKDRVAVVIGFCVLTGYGDAIGSQLTDR